ncbi:MAG TPA: hypothetical protein VGQ28_18335 [Thermoanaerobaculia bacterium]|nr:hypothetical protein [Thermoanaerobaculia bacterium]
MDDDPEDLFARLSPEARQLAPIGYRFLHPSPTRNATIMRLAESSHYRAGGYVCAGFRKPISKCCRQDDEL